MLDDQDAVPLVELRDVQRHFRLAGPMPWSRQRGTIHAVDGVSFDLGRKRTISLVGESGCGKTTTARMILDLDQPTGGSIRYLGQDLASLRGSDRRRYRTAVQAVFQDPTSALNPRRRIGAIVGEPLLVNEGLRGKALAARVEDLLVAVGLDPALRRSFPVALSGGMRQRVAVAQALALRPSVIVLDEPVSALDVSIRAQIMNLLKDLQSEFGISYILIAHDLATVRYLSDEVAAMYLGQIVEHAESKVLFTHAMHPYTIALMSAVGSARAESDRQRIVLPGEVGSPAKPPPGCRFHPRCWLRRELGDPARCSTEAPALRPMAGAGQRVSCHFAEELAEPDRRAELINAAAARSIAGPSASPTLSTRCSDDQQPASVKSAPAFRSLAYGSGRFSKHG